MLPKYWAVKIDKEHPLWETFLEYIKKEFKFGDEDELVNWKYIAEDYKNEELNMANQLYDFRNPVPEITLEQYFGDIHFEIY
jgi:hypothetical protein